MLDGPGAAWRVDHAFADRMPNGRWRDFAISVLQEASFATDGTGARLPRSVLILLAASWDRTDATTHNTAWEVRAGLDTVVRATAVRAGAAP